MPFKDRERARAYHARYDALRRERRRQTRLQPRVVLPFQHGVWLDRVAAAVAVEGLLAAWESKRVSAIPDYRAEGRRYLDLAAQVSRVLGIPLPPHVAPALAAPPPK